MTPTSYALNFPPAPLRQYFKEFIMQKIESRLRSVIILSIKMYFKDKMFCIATVCTA